MVLIAKYKNKKTAVRPQHDVMFLLTYFVLECDCAFCLQTCCHWPVSFNFSRTNVTVKGKTDTNGKPLERQKRTDDERLTNGP